MRTSSLLEAGDMGRASNWVELSKQEIVWDEQVCP
jgi:hypothetical protein